MSGSIAAGTGLLGYAHDLGEIIKADVGEEQYHPVSAVGFGSTQSATWDLHSDIGKTYLAMKLIKPLVVHIAAHCTIPDLDGNKSTQL